MDKILKRAAWLLLMIIFVIHVAPFIIYIGSLIGLNLRSETYIGYVHTPSHPSSLNELLELNRRGYGKVIKTSGYRPIIVLESDLTDMGPIDPITKQKYVLLGQTYPMGPYCLVDMNSKMPKEVNYKEILWHELMHCYFILHSNLPNDIMAAVWWEHIDLNTIDSYLEYLSKL